MKKALLLPVLVLLISFAPVGAKNKPARLFMLRETVTLDGMQIPAGIYQLSWETQGSKGRVTLSKDGQFVASAPAVWTKNGVKFKDDEVLLLVNSDGTKSLIEIRIAGASKAIVFNRTDTTIHYSAMKP